MKRYKEITRHIIQMVKSDIRCNCQYCTTPETQEMIEQFRLDHAHGIDHQ